MSKQVRNLILGGAAVALLAAVMVLVLWLPNLMEESSSSSTTSKTTISLMDKKMNDVQKVEIQNEEDSYTVLHGEEDDSWYIEALGDLPTSKDHFQFLAQQCSSLQALQKAADTSENLADFGLDSPKATVDIAYSDGSTEQIIVGNDSLNSGTYIKLASDDAIYLANSDSLNAFYYKAITYVSRELYVAPATEEETDSEGNPIYPAIQKMTLSGKNNPVPLILEKMEDDDSSTSQDPSEIDYLQGSHVIVSPKEKDINESLFNEVANSIFGTEAVRTVSVFPTEEELEEYGLADPYAVLELDYIPDEEVCHLKWTVSEPKDGVAYLMLNEYQAIYEIEIPEGTSWVVQTYGTMATRIQLLPYINNIASIEVATPDKNYDFQLSYSQDSSDESKEVLSVTGNGQELNPDSFRQLYQVLVGSTSSSYTTEQPEEGAEPVLSYRFHYRDSSKEDDVIEFFAGPTRQVFISLNGETEFLVSQVYIDKVYSDLEKVFTGEEIATDW